MSRIQSLRRILAERTIARDAGEQAFESSSEGDTTNAALPHVDDTLDRVNKIIAALPERERGDPQELRKALDTLLRHGEPALKKLADLDAGPDYGLTDPEAGALEALIATDGSRPSFLLNNGRPPLDHPFLRDWIESVSSLQQEIRRVANAVGRVQPTGGSNDLYFGTAFLVDAGKGLLLTNYHVVDDARLYLGAQAAPNGHKIRFTGGLEVDFGGEFDNEQRNVFAVVEAALPENYGRGAAFVDMAVLNVEPLNGESRLPSQAVICSASKRYMESKGYTLCTIGYPGRPNIGGAASGIDWNFVVSTLFNNLFGYKRMAPGRPSRELGSIPADRHKIVFGHDATTFRGASGSPVFAWQDQDGPAFGLHFGGTTLEENHAITLERVASELRRLGVPL